MMTWLLGGVVVAMVVMMVVNRLRQVSPQQARHLVSQGARLLDVRTRHEFQSGHLDGALNIPLSELPGRLADVGPKERSVVVYCLSGGRSAQACSVLRQAGFAAVFDLGGMHRF